MDKNTLDCSKLPVHPHAPAFRGWIKDNVPKMLERKLDGLDQLTTMKYIYLMYHYKSPIHDVVDVDWYGKKFEAAEAAGFVLSTDKQGHLRFKKEVLEALLGKNEGFNDAIVDYVAWLNNTVWTELVYLQETLMKYIKESLSAMEMVGKSLVNAPDGSSVKTVREIYDRMGILVKRLTLDEQDTEDLIRRIYHRVEESRLAIRPEDYAKRLLEGDKLEKDTPYGTSYTKTPPLTFVGKTIPKRNKDVKSSD